MNERQRQNFEQLKAWRGPRERDLSLATTIVSIAKFAKKRQRDLGEVIAAWNALCPAKLGTACTVDSLTNGLLSMTASSAAAGYELSRLLRTGLDEEMKRRFPTRIRRIKVTIGEVAESTPAARAQVENQSDQER